MAIDHTFEALCAALLPVQCEVGMSLQRDLLAVMVARFPFDQVGGPLYLRLYRLGLTAWTKEHGTTSLQMQATLKTIARKLATWYRAVGNTTPAERRATIWAASEQVRKR